jgi:hypothetical protein
MPPDAITIFLASVAFNLISKFALRYVGRLRAGVDSLLFCSIMTGYFYGAKAGFVYSALIAITFYAINIKWIAHAPYVIPLNAAAGALAALLSASPLVSVTFYVLFFYHIISFIIVFFAYRSVGFGYFLFAALNFVTTYLLIGVFAGF